MLRIFFWLLLIFSIVKKQVPIHGYLFLNSKNLRELCWGTRLYSTFLSRETLQGGLIWWKVHLLANLFPIRGSQGRIGNSKSGRGNCGRPHHHITTTSPLLFNSKLKWASKKSFSLLSLRTWFQNDDFFFLNTKYKLKLNNC